MIRIDLNLSFLSSYMSPFQTYNEAQADAVPPYWETTVHAPAGLDPNADLIIDDLPTGSFLIFCLNVFISFFFQFVGFLLTYLLHTSHAAKFGSRAGLGLTLIQYGFYSRAMNFADENQDGTGAQGTEGSWLATPTSVPDAVATGVPDPQTSQSTVDVISGTSKDWLSFLFMTLGKHRSIPRPSTYSDILILCRLVPSSVVCDWFLEGQTMGTNNSPIASPCPSYSRRY